MTPELENKQRILETARSLFFQFGFSQVTMEQVATQLGMSKKTLYQYFASKEELLQDVASAYLLACDERMLLIYKDPKLDVLERFQNIIADLVSEYSKFSSALVYDLKRSMPQIWQQVEEHRKHCIKTYFGDLIREGIKKKIFREDIDAELFLIIYTNVVQSTLNPNVLSELPFQPALVFDTIIKVLFQGLLTDKARIKYHAKP